MKNCMRMQKNQKDRNIDEKKITTDHYKIERSILGWRNRKKYVMVRIFYISKLRIYRSTGGLLKGQYY